ncbi:hypothetical protein K438DRAFT_1749397 [Mycena galopus ATCC 62051]|nr:hypothetical protein K438DRAFT_1749397 [Mycena galopus ATCC 62051]
MRPAGPTLCMVQRKDSLSKLGSSISLLGRRNIFQESGLVFGVAGKIDSFSANTGIALRLETCGSETMYGACLNPCGRARACIYTIGETRKGSKTECRPRPSETRSRQIEVFQSEGSETAKARIQFTVEASENLADDTVEGWRQAEVEGQCNRREGGGERRAQSTSESEFYLGCNTAIKVRLPESSQYHLPISGNIQQAEQCSQDEWSMHGGRSGDNRPEWDWKGKEAREDIEIWMGACQGTTARQSGGALRLRWRRRRWRLDEGGTVLGVDKVLGRWRRGRIFCGWSESSSLSLLNASIGCRFSFLVARLVLIREESRNGEAGETGRPGRRGGRGDGEAGETGRPGRRGGRGNEGKSELASPMPDPMFAASDRRHIQEPGADEYDDYFRLQQHSPLPLSLVIARASRLDSIGRQAEQGEALVEGDAAYMSRIDKGGGRPSSPTRSVLPHFAVSHSSPTFVLVLEAHFSSNSQIRQGKRSQAIAHCVDLPALRIPRVKRVTHQPDDALRTRLRRRRVGTAEGKEARRDGTRAAPWVLHGDEGERERLLAVLDVSDRDGEGVLLLLLAPFRLFILPIVHVKAKAKEQGIEYNRRVTRVPVSTGVGYTGINNLQSTTQRLRLIPIHSIRHGLHMQRESGGLTPGLRSRSVALPAYLTWPRSPSSPFSFSHQGQPRVHSRRLDAHVRIDLNSPINIHIHQGLHAQRRSGLTSCTSGGGTGPAAGTRRDFNMSSYGGLHHRDIAAGGSKRSRRWHCWIVPFGFAPSESSDADGDVGGKLTAVAGSNRHSRPVPPLPLSIPIPLPAPSLCMNGRLPTDESTRPPPIHPPRTRDTEHEQASRMRGRRRRCGGEGLDDDDVGGKLAQLRSARAAPAATLEGSTSISVMAKAARRREGQVQVSNERKTLARMRSILFFGKGGWRCGDSGDGLDGSLRIRSSWATPTAWRRWRNRNRVPHRLEESLEKEREWLLRRGGCVLRAVGAVAGKDRTGRSESDRGGPRQWHGGGRGIGIGIGIGWRKVWRKNGNSCWGGRDRGGSESEGVLTRWNWLETATKDFWSSLSFGWGRRASFHLQRRELASFVLVRGAEDAMVHIHEHIYIAWRIHRQVECAVDVDVGAGKDLTTMWGQARSAQVGTGTASPATLGGSTSTSVMAKAAPRREGQCRGAVGAVALCAGKDWTGRSESDRGGPRQWRRWRNRKRVPHRLEESLEKEREWLLRRVGGIEQTAVAPSVLLDEREVDAEVMHVKDVYFGERRRRRRLWTIPVLRRGGRMTASRDARDVKELPTRSQGCSGRRDRGGSESEGVWSLDALGLAGDDNQGCLELLKPLGRNRCINMGAGIRAGREMDALEYVGDWGAILRILFRPAYLFSSDGDQETKRKIEILRVLRDTGHANKEPAGFKKRREHHNWVDDRELALALDSSNWCTFSVMVLFQ